MNNEELKKDIENEIVNILKDCLDDKKTVIKRLQATIILLILLLAGTFCYYEWSFKAFMSQYDYENVITTELSTDNNSKITNSQSTNAQNNINLNIPKLKGN